MNKETKANKQTDNNKIFLPIRLEQTLNKYFHGDDLSRNRRIIKTISIIPFLMKLLFPFFIFFFSVGNAHINRFSPTVAILNMEKNMLLPLLTTVRFCPKPDSPFLSPTSVCCHFFPGTAIVSGQVFLAYHFPWLGTDRISAA